MKNVQVRYDLYVDFSMDESVFTDEFMREFSTCFFEADMNDHYKHIAWSLAQGFAPDSIEGYPDGCIKLIAIEHADAVIEHVAEVQS